MKKVMIIYSLVLVFGLIGCSNETSARQVDKEDDQANETKTSIERESEREAIDGEVETEKEGLNKKYEESIEKKEEDQENETKTRIERESEREAIDGEVETDTEGLNKNEGECLAEDEKIYRSNY